MTNFISMPVLGSKPFDPADFQYNSAGADVIHVRGVSIDRVYEDNARWGWYDPGDNGLVNNGMLHRDGCVTLINPDRSAPVGFVQITVGESLHFSADKFEINSCLPGCKSGISIKIFPRNPDNLNGSAPPQPFEQMVRGNIPDAAYIASSNSGWINVSGTYRQADLSERFSFLNPVAVWGLPILHIQDRQPLSDAKKIIDALCDSDLLGVRAGVREAFRELFTHFTASKPLPIIQAVKPALNK